MQNLWTTIVAPSTAPQESSSSSVSLRPSSDGMLRLRHEACLSTTQMRAVKRALPGLRWSMAESRVFANFWCFFMTYRRVSFIYIYKKVAQQSPVSIRRAEEENLPAFDRSLQNSNLLVDICRFLIVRSRDRLSVRFSENLSFCSFSENFFFSKYQ